MFLGSPKWQQWWDGMGWDGMMFPSSLCKGSPHWQPFWFSQLRLHASFSLSSRNLFQNSADLFCFRTSWFSLLEYCPYPRLNAAYHLPGAVAAPGQKEEPMPAACLSQSLQDFGHSLLWRWCKCWKLSPELNCKRVREFTSVEKQIIIISNRLGNCVCNHFLLKALVHPRRETSWFLCKEECHDDLSLKNHPVSNLHFPVFSITVALFSLEKQPESTSDFLGNFEGQLC